MNRLSIFDKIKHHPVKAVLLAASAVMLIYTVWTAVSIWDFAKIDETRAADTAIILGAGTHDGEVSPVFAERIHHGIRLYEQGYVKKLIFTGGYGEGNTFSDAYTAKQYAMSKGVPAGDIFIEEKSTITQENIEYAKTIMEEQKLQSALLVSDPLHMKRSMLMARDAGITTYSSPTTTTRYISFKNKIIFWGREVFFYIGYQITRAIL